MPRDRVAVISNSLSSTFVFRKSLVRKLRQMDRLAFVLSTRDDRAFVQQAGNKYEVILLTGEGLIRKLCSFRSVVARCRQSSVEIFHGFTHQGNLVATLLWLFVGGKLILSVTGMGRVFSSPKISYTVARWLIILFYAVSQFLVKYIIVQNRDDFNLLAKVFLPRMRSKIRVTNGSGIDLCFFDDTVPDLAETGVEKVRVGFFSRALAEKGVDAYYRLAARFEGDECVEFSHWGHGGPGAYSEERIAETARKSNVIYRGFSIDPRSHILAMDIIVLPSAYREGLSRLSIEAMLAGKVVVARVTAGVRDHLESGKNAIVYEDSDGLYAAFNQALLGDRVAIGRAAKDYAIREFDVDLVDRVYFAAYGFEKAVI